MDKSTVRRALVVAGVAGATMGVELVQTRILSFLYYNHVVYLTVTVALLGFGISGVFISLRAKQLVNPDGYIAGFIGLFAISIIASLTLAAGLPTAMPAVFPLIKLLLSYILLVPPFMFAGAALGLMFMRNSDQMYDIYFADLAASALGAMAFVFLLRPLGAPLFVWLCASVAFAAFVAQAWDTVPKRAIVVYAVIFATFAVVFNHKVAGSAPEPYKTLGRYFTPSWKTATVERTEWTPISRIDVVSDPGRDLVLGKPDPSASQIKMITQDSDAFTIMLGRERVQSIMDSASQGQLGGSLDTVYHLNPKPADALIIGVGGGIDIVKAEAHGAQRITGVEINPATVGLMQGPYRNFAVWPNWSNVEEVNAEGRHFVRTTNRRFDTLVMSGIDTFSALSSGAYVLSENYLYTVEAINDYLNVVKPDGTVAVFRWFFQQPRETLRLSNLYINAAESRGMAHPEQGVMVISEDVGWDFRWATTLMKRRPFTPDEVRMVLQLVEQNPKLSVVYIPKVFPQQEQETIEQKTFARDAEYLRRARVAFGGLFATAGAPVLRRAFENSYPYRIDPTADEHPFFFEYFKRGAQEAVQPTKNFLDRDGLASIRGNVARYVLQILALCATAAGVICMIVPLFVFERQGLNVPGAFPLITFVAMVGFGFMFIEIGLMQRLTLFVGDPTSTMAIVLAGLLFFCGAGSWLAGRIGVPEASNIWIGAISSALLAALAVAAIRFGLPLAIKLPFAARAAMVLISLAPLGLAMGFPFASAVKYLGARYERFVPWAWGVNGLASVVASVAAIMVAMRSGFSTVILAGAGIYLAALLMFRWHLFAAAREEVILAPVSEVTE